MVESLPASLLEERLGYKLQMAHIKPVDTLVRRLYLKTSIYTIYNNDDDDDDDDEPRGPLSRIHPMIW